MELAIAFQMVKYFEYELHGVQVRIPKSTMKWKLPK